MLCRICITAAGLKKTFCKQRLSVFTNIKTYNKIFIFFDSVPQQVIQGEQKDEPRKVSVYEIRHDNLSDQ